MLTLTDCEDYCDISTDAIKAFARNQNLPEIIAAELANAVLSEPNGFELMRQIIKDELRAARLDRDQEECDRLERVLEEMDKQCLKTDPAACSEQLVQLQKTG